MKWGINKIFRKIDRSFVNDFWYDKYSEPNVQVEEI